MIKYYFFTIFLLSLSSLLTSAEKYQQIIEQEAQKKWEGNSEMIEFQIKDENESYEALQGYIPDNIVVISTLTDLKNHAAKKWPTSYRHQLWYVKTEIEAIRSLQHLKSPEGMTPIVFSLICAEAVKAYPESNSFTLQRIKDEYKAWKSLKLHPASEAQKTKIATQWPKSYTMQLNWLNK